MVRIAIASRGDGIYLIDLGGGQGAILHTTSEPPRLWPSQSIASIAKFGYWEELPDGFDQNQISAALDHAEHAGIHPHRLTVEE